MNMAVSDLQNDLVADVLSIRPRCELPNCPRRLACKKNAVEPVDGIDELSWSNLKTKVVTLVLKYLKALPESEMMNKGQDAKPFDLLDIELTECQKQADSAVWRTLEFRDEAKKPSDVPKTRRKN